MSCMKYYQMGLVLCLAALVSACKKADPSFPEVESREEKVEKEVGDEMLKKDDVEMNLKGKMNNKRLGRLINKVDPDAKGENGAWRFFLNEMELICFTDESADRMRIMTAVAPLSEVTEAQLAECMKANFDRALDARYCVNHEILWSAFIHPLGSLTDELFDSAVSQVGSASETFGKEYSSGTLFFGGGEKSEKGGSGPLRADEESEGPTI